MSAELPLKPKIFLGTDEGTIDTYSLEKCTITEFRDFLNEMIKRGCGEKMIRISGRTIGTCTVVVPWHGRYLIIG